jgi:predicted alpha/beta hydrolase family esterase
MTNYFIVPGLGNSGEEHWQTFFERSGDNFRRINQQEWDAPICTDWVTSIDNAISSYDLSTVVLIAHSLGCPTIAHWATQYNKKIKGALLVAPSDIEAQNYTFPAKGFAPVPINKINFKTIVVASTNDIWVTADRAKFFADSWNSEFISLGDAGHINAVSGYGQWQQGLEILKTLG